MTQKKHQRGYSVTAMMVMLAVGSIVTAATARYSINMASQNAGTAIGTGLNDVNLALGTYTIFHYKALVDGTKSLTPTIADLQNAGVLNANINPTPAIGGSYAMEISREPSGCIAPNCNLTSRVWYTQPILNPDNGRLDIAKLGAAAAAMDGDGGWSDSLMPGVIRGTTGWSRANPVGTQPGILMAINGYGSSVFSQYVDRAGVQGMLGDLKMGNNNIVGAATVNAAQVVLPAGQSLLLGQVAIGSTRNSMSIVSDAGVWFRRQDGTSTDISGVNNINASGGIASSEGLYSDKNVEVAGEASVGGWFRTRGDSGWYSEKWGGGMYMTDGSWVRTVGDKGVYTGGQVQAGSITSNSDLTVSRNATVVGNQNVGTQTVYGQQIIGGSQTVYGNVAVTNAVTPGQIASEGGYCGGNAGAIARDANNNLFICN